MLHKLHAVSYAGTHHFPNTPLNKLGSSFLLSTVHPVGTCWLAIDMSLSQQEGKHSANVKPGHIKQINRQHRCTHVLLTIQLQHSTPCVPTLCLVYSTWPSSNLHSPSELLTDALACSTGAAPSSKLSRSIRSARGAAAAATAAGAAGMPFMDILAGLLSDSGEAARWAGDEGRSELAGALSEAWPSAVGDATAAGASTCLMKG